MRGGDTPRRMLPAWHAALRWQAPCRRVLCSAWRLRQPPAAARSTEAIKKSAEGGEQVVTVLQDTRLDNRIIDLRTPANQAIMRVQSAVCQVWRRGDAPVGRAGVTGLHARRRVVPATRSCSSLQRARAGNPGP